MARKKPGPKPGVTQKARCVWLPDSVHRDGLKRAAAQEMSFSRYVRRLIERDLKEGK